MKGPQQCFNCLKFGHHAMTCSSEIQTWRYCTWRHNTYQCKDNKQQTLKSKKCGHEHATTSLLCPKRMEAVKKANNRPASHRTTQKHDNRKPAPIPLANAWATLTVHEVVLFTPTINSHNNTRNHQATNGSKYKTIKANSKELNTKNNAEEKVRTSKGSTRPTANHQCMEKAVRTINKGISCRFDSKQDKTFPFHPSNQCQPISTPPANGRIMKQYTLHSAVQHLYSGRFLPVTFI